MRRAGALVRARGCAGKGGGRGTRAPAGVCLGFCSCEFVLRCEVSGLMSVRNS